MGIADAYSVTIDIASINVYALEGVMSIIITVKSMSFRPLPGHWCAHAPKVDVESIPEMDEPSGWPAISVEPVGNQHSLQCDESVADVTVADVNEPVDDQNN